MNVRFLAAGLAFAAAAFAEGESYSWPVYAPTISYNMKELGMTYSTPTSNHYDSSCESDVAGEQASDWWVFRWGSYKNSLVTEAAITPMLERFEEDFAYLRDSMGYAPDLRAQDGYRSTIYLYGSIACSGSTNSEDLGGWASWIDGYPAVIASYYPVYSFDPDCDYGDAVDQQSLMVHEGLHMVSNSLGGASHVHWFQEGGIVWLQQEMDSRRTGDYGELGYLNTVSVIAPFIPIECYSGWLLDGTFGGPGAQGVEQYRSDGVQYCNWRNLLGGAQYGDMFPTFLALWVDEYAVPWLWANANDESKYLLETIADSIGDEQARLLITEYRAKLALLDMKEWSSAVKDLYGYFGTSISCEYSPCYQDVETWTATPYTPTTDSSGWLIPDTLTLPGWSGANIVALTVSQGSTVYVTLKPAGSYSNDTNMTLVLGYRASDGTPIYSTPVTGSGTASLTISETPADNILFAVVVNTDYAYEGDETRSKHFDYRLYVENATTASTTTRWYYSLPLDYDWESAKVESSSTETSSESNSETSSSSNAGGANSETSSSSSSTELGTSSSSNSEISGSSDSSPIISAKPKVVNQLGLSISSGIVTANYEVSTAGRVKLGLYTAYGALITNLVNERHSAGSYSKVINLQDLGLPSGAYLVRLSLPEGSETKAVLLPRRH